MLREVTMSDEETWLDALAAYEKVPMGRRKVELNSIIRPVLERLKAETQTVEELRAMYYAGDEWWLEIARTGYPHEPRMWEKHRTADVAYGMRYKQLWGEAPAR
jgi:hypothetical protein